MGKTFNEYRMITIDEDTSEKFYKNFETKMDVRNYIEYLKKFNEELSKETGNEITSMKMKIEVRKVDENYNPLNDWEELNENWEKPSSQELHEEINEWVERKGN